MSRKVVPSIHAAGTCQEPSRISLLVVHVDDTHCTNWCRCQRPLEIHHRRGWPSFRWKKRHGSSSTRSRLGSIVPLELLWDSRACFCSAVSLPDSPVISSFASHFQVPFRCSGSGRRKYRRHLRISLCRPSANVLSVRYATRQRFATRGQGLVRACSAERDV